jgi:NADH:ubiquinone oxidoreductase subunit 5 (subunit L)/multisubunit Na+/H+ antiporter MnhA subunit
MGVLTVLLGIGLHGDIPAGLLLPAIALYAFNHGTAKALLFMGTALPGKVGGWWRILMWAGLGLGALAIAGGPLTGGLWTKSLVKTFLGETSLPGAPTFLLLLKLSAVTTTLLLSRFLHLLDRIKAPSGKVAPGFFLPWVLLLLAGGWWTMSPMLLPGELLTHVTGTKGITDFFLNGLKNWAAFWPIALGAVILVITLKFASLNRWPTTKPLLPPGDFIHPILLAGAWVAKPMRKGIALMSSGIQSIPGPEKIFYRISDSKRISQISDAAESLLQRWVFVGIGFFIFFLTLFFFLR